MDIIKTNNLISKNGNLSIDVFNDSDPKDINFSINSIGDHSETISINAPYGGINLQSTELKLTSKIHTLQSSEINIESQYLDISTPNIYLGNKDSKIVIKGNIILEGQLYDNQGQKIHSSNLLKEDTEQSLPDSQVLLLKNNILEIHKNLKTKNLEAQALQCQYFFWKNVDLRHFLEPVVGKGCRFENIKDILDYYNTSQYSYSCPLIIKIKSNKIYQESIVLKHNNIILEGDEGYPLIKGKLQFQNYTNIKKSRIKFLNLKLYLQQSTLLCNHTSELYFQNCTITEISKIKLSVPQEIPEETLKIITKYLEIRDTKINGNLSINCIKFLISRNRFKNLEICDYNTDKKGIINHNLFQSSKPDIFSKFYCQYNMFNVIF